MSIPSVKTVPMTTTIDLLRHGEPVGGSRYRGQIDDALSEKGWHQMRDAVAGHAPWNAVATSPLARCHAFATELAVQRRLPLTVDEGLKEIGFGVWEGKTRAELTAQDPEQLQRFYCDPVRHRPEGAELLDGFAQRVTEAVARIVEAHRGRHLLVVAHAGVIRAVISSVLGLPYPQMFRLQISNASISRVEMNERAPPTLQFHNGRL